MRYSEAKVAGVLFAVGSVGFIIAMNVAEFLYSGYSVSQNYISDLGATCRNSVCAIVQPTSTIFNSSVFLLGVLIVAGAYLVYRGLKAKIFTPLLILSGIGAMGVGIFPETTGVVHEIVSLIVFLFGGLSAIASYTITKRPLNYFSIALGIFTLSALFLFMSGNYLGLGPGGMERLIAYPALLWGTSLGGYLMQSPSQKLTAEVGSVQKNSL
jgi:hypothetical membrane protein